MTDMAYSQIAPETYGKKIANIRTLPNDKADNDELRITFDDGTYLFFTHYQDCCESVWIEDTDIPLEDLIGSCVFHIEEATKREIDYEWDDSTTWTFYKIQTNTQCVTIRWCGTSNGYYSESVDWQYVDPSVQEFDDEEDY